MKIVNKLLLLSGADIPFIEGQAIIHQPSIKEISLIGEDSFFTGCGVLNFSKNLIDIKDKKDLNAFDDFDILMAILEQNEPQVQYAKDVLTLLFNNYQVEIQKDKIELINENRNGFIDKTNFAAFKKIISELFVLDGEGSSSQFNPKGDFAKEIARKLKERQKKLQQQKGGIEDTTIFGRYISILSIGMGVDMNSLFNYTIFQIYDSIRRLEAKRAWDSYVQAKIAGATNLDEVEDWERDLYDETQDKNK